MFWLYRRNYSSELFRENIFTLCVALECRWDFDGLDLNILSRTSRLIELVARGVGSIDYTLVKRRREPHSWVRIWNVALWRKRERVWSPSSRGSKFFRISSLYNAHITGNVKSGSVYIFQEITLLSIWVREWLPNLANNVISDFLCICTISFLL